MGRQQQLNHRVVGCVNEQKRVVDAEARRALSQELHTPPNVLQIIRATEHTDLSDCVVSIVKFGG